MGFSINGQIFSPGGDIGGGATINGVPIGRIGVLPLVNGDTIAPFIAVSSVQYPVFITDGKGQCIGVPLA